MRRYILIPVFAIVVGLISVDILCMNAARNRLAEQGYNFDLNYAQSDLDFRGPRYQGCGTGVEYLLYVYRWCFILTRSDEYPQHTYFSYRLILPQPIFLGGGRGESSIMNYWDSAQYLGTVFLDGSVEKL